MSKPALRLRELIEQKYGEDRFALGCYIVCRWMTTPNFRCTVNLIEGYCNTKQGQSVGLLPAGEEKLRKLFGLKNSADLYTNE